MNKNVVLALIAGLLGGLLARYIAPPSAFAQNQAPPIAKEIRAQSFTLVDQSNQNAGTFAVEPAGGPGMHTRIVLRDINGIELWSAGGNAVRPISQK
jgi:hypothetical protein